jgi:hypothetical protein
MPYPQSQVKVYFVVAEYIVNANKQKTKINAEVATRRCRLDGLGLNFNFKIS